jgi:hypothetical protein
MGHDIYGYRTKTDLDASEDGENSDDHHIAYLRRGAFNPLKTEIYKALNCLEFNGGCSGNGDHKEFTKEQLLAALDYLGYDECLDTKDAYFGDLHPEIEFVRDCLKNLNNEGTIWIGFY